MEDLPAVAAFEEVAQDSNSGGEGEVVDQEDKEKLRVKEEGA